MGNEVKVLKDDMSTWWNKLPKEVRSVALVSAGVLGGIGLGRATGAFKNKAPVIKSASMPIIPGFLFYDGIGYVPTNFYNTLINADNVLDAAYFAATTAQNVLNTAVSTKNSCLNESLAAVAAAAPAAAAAAAAAAIVAANTAKKAAERKKMVERFTKAGWNI